jgi:hypothetical protein
MSSSIAKRTRFIANVGGSTLRPRDELYMLFVAVDIDNGTFEPVWLVPSLDFVKKTKPNHRNRSSGSAMRETASPRTEFTTRLGNDAPLELDLAGRETEVILRRRMDLGDDVTCAQIRSMRLGSWQPSFCPRLVNQEPSRAGVESEHLILNRPAPPGLLSPRHLGIPCPPRGLVDFGEPIELPAFEVAKHPPKPIGVKRSSESPQRRVRHW